MQRATLSEPSNPSEIYVQYPVFLKSSQFKIAFHIAQGVLREKKREIDDSYQIYASHIKNNRGAVPSAQDNSYQPGYDIDGLVWCKVRLLA